MIGLLTAFYCHPVIAAPAGGHGAGVIVPDAARWNAWVLAPGDRRVLTTAPTLAKGGQWTALFGRIRDNGDGTMTYSAPADVPPYGLDEIDYGPGAFGPYIQLMVFVCRRVDPPASLTPQWQPQPVVRAPSALIRRVPGEFRQDYAQTLRWLRRQRRAGAPARSGGYVLPAWVDDDSVEVYTPAASPRGARQARPVVCKSPGPVNPYPAVRAGTPRSRRAVVGIWQAVPVQSGGWRSNGKWAGDISPTDARTIRALYGTSLKPGPLTLLNRESQDWVYHRVRYSDHYVRADFGRGWIYVGTTLCDQQGEGSLFSPAWLSVEMAWPPHGDPMWLQPSCRDIHVWPWPR